MKFFPLVLLFVFAFSSPLVETESKDPIDIIICVIEKIGPITKDVVEILDAIKEKDWIKVAIISARLIEEGRLTFVECFQEEYFLNINWAAFGKCLLENGASSISELAAIVEAILDKDWAKVKELAIQTSIKYLPMVIDCYNRAG